MNPETTQNTDVDTLILLRHGPQRITREYLQTLPTDVLVLMSRVSMLDSLAEPAEMVEQLLLYYRMNTTYVKAYNPAAGARLITTFHDRLAYYLRSHYLHEFD